MSLFLFRFWPVLVPLIIYWMWWRVMLHRARRNDGVLPRFRDGPWYWAVLASLATGAACFIYLGLTQDPRKGDYAPPHLEDGRLVPGRVIDGE